MNEQKYTIVAPIGNFIAPAGQVTVQELRDFGASTSTEPMWKEKFAKESIEDVLSYFKAAGFIVKAV